MTTGRLRIPYPDRAPRGGRWNAIPALLVAALLLTLSTGAQAQTPADAYQATTIVTGTDMRSRPSGFATCLRDVLVRVSGEPRLATDPRVDTLVAQADTLVAAFDYVDRMSGIRHHDEQGSYDRPFYLTVRFDPVRIDAVLGKLGESVWSGERPTLMPVMVVRGFVPPYVLTSDAPGHADQRAAFADAAAKYAMKLSLPTASEVAAWGVSTDGFPAPHAASDPHLALIAGTLEFSQAALGWVGTWHLAWGGQTYAWTISGVNYDEAFRDAVRGAMRVISGHGAPA